MSIGRWESRSSRPSSRLASSYSICFEAAPTFVDPHQQGERSADDPAHGLRPRERFILGGEYTLWRFGERLRPSFSASAVTFIAAAISSSTTLYSPVLPRRPQVRSSPEASSATGWLDGPVIEPHPFEFLADKPDAKHARYFVVIEDIRVDRIHRHDGATGFQHHEIARLDNRSLVKPTVSAANASVALRS